MMAVVSYWRDLATGDVHRQVIYEDGTVLEPRPESGTEDATEQDYYVGLGEGESALSGWLQAGINASGS
jgi:hypothetical protein